MHSNSLNVSIFEVGWCQRIVMYCVVIITDVKYFHMLNIVHILYLNWIILLLYTILLETSAIFITWYYSVLFHLKHLLFVSVFLSWLFICEFIFFLLFHNLYIVIKSTLLTLSSFVLYSTARPISYIPLFFYL